MKTDPKAEAVIAQHDQWLREEIEERIDRERLMQKDIRDHNCVGWGMCSGAIEAYETVLAILVDRR